MCYVSERERERVGKLPERASRIVKGGQNCGSGRMDKENCGYQRSTYFTDPSKFRFYQASLLSSSDVIFIIEKLLNETFG